MKDISRSCRGNARHPRSYRLLWLTLIFLILSEAISRRAAAAGTWTPLANKPITGLRNALLLSDGTVMCGDGGRGWYRLTPDIHGSYITGTWSSLPTTHYSRYYFSSDVLTNGSVYIAGGEYDNGGDHAELYDSLRNVWSDIPPPGSYPDYSDAISKILPNGNVLQGTTGSGTWIYNAVQNTITGGPSAARGQDETCWVKLPNDNILTVDGGTKSEHYVSSLNAWYQDGNVPVALFGWGDELGAGYLLPNGNVFYIGGSVNTAIYTPGNSVTAAGTWVAGPQMVFGTNGFGAVDAPSAMMFNGKILCALGPTNGFTAPTSFFEYDYTSNAFTQVNGPTGTTLNKIPYESTMLDLPDGNVLLIPDQAQLYVYTPDGSPLAAGQPVINTLTENPDGSYQITGTGLNGISAGAAYGDDWQMDSNYPLVRMTNSLSGNVYYARTYNWNSTSVMTGSRIVTTQLTLPPNLPAGTYYLVAVANGNASAPVTFVYSPLAAPAGLSAAAGDTQLGLTWNAVSGATSYDLKRSTNGGAYFATIATLSETGYMDSNLINGVTYEYVVSAVGSGGPSTNSLPLAVAPVGRPPVPTGLAAGPDSYLGVNLAWNATPGALYYNVKCSATSGGPYVTIATSPVGSYDDTAVAERTTYYYVVSAVGPIGESANSPQAVATPLGIGDVTNGLMGYWRFDEGTGTITADSSGNNNNGTLVNGPTWDSPGWIGPAALSFVSTNEQYVTVPDAPSLDMTSAITVAAWVNAVDWSGNHRVLEKGNSDNQYLFLADNNELRLHLNNVNTLVCPLPAAGAWAYVAATWDGSNIVMYVNGQPQAMMAATGAISTTANPLTIGAKNGSTADNDYMNGELDEVRLYNRALSLPEINTIMHDGDVFPVIPTGAVAAPGNSQVCLSWSASAGASSYIIMRSTVRGGPYNEVNTSFSTNYTDGGLTNGTTYYYVVVAANYNNGSAQSSEVSAKPGIGVTFFAGANYTGSGSQLLGPGSYLLAQLEANGIGNNGTASCRIPPGWRVTAYQNDSYGGQSWTLTSDTPNFTILSGLNNSMSSCSIVEFTPPPALATLHATAGDTQVGISWTASTIATQYVLQRSTTSGGPYTPLITTTATNFTDTGLINGTTYYYVVAAANAAGNGTNSAQAAATPWFTPIQLRIGPSAPGQFSFQFPGIAGRNYIIETSSNLVTWTPVLTNQPAGGVLIYTDTNAAGSEWFYRVKQ